MVMAKEIKLYAAYKAGFLGNNIFDTYFSLLANMICEKNLKVVEDTVIAEMLNDRYSFDLPLQLIRQVLGEGVSNGCFIENHGKYSVDSAKISLYRFDETEFSTLWESLIQEFTDYCQKNNINTDTINVSNYILDCLDDSDEKILSGEKVDNGEQSPALEYAWYSFVKEQGEAHSQLFLFISAISASNILKQALFYSGETTADYSDLCVYLDSPIIFALLGMDEDARVESYRRLVSDMLKAHCSVHVFDHNFQEVDGIIARAATWANSTQYDITKASNAAAYFHDRKMSEEDISEFCESIEDKLNELGITQIKTEYDTTQNEFQEDENTLFNMVKEKYRKKGFLLTPEKERTIRIDVRSIIMVYRERKNQTATRIDKAKHLLLTSNNAIANVSKQYESNVSLQAGHIPACISADLFGAILWLNNPMELIEYQKRKVLADCYAYLKPDKELLEKYIRSLDEAYKLDEIDEKKYLFLRTHRVVLDSLMSVTKGDYARFNAKTYLEVYEDIQARAMKKYDDEVESHSQTRKELDSLKETIERERIETAEKIATLLEENTQKIQQLTSQIAEMKESEERRVEEARQKEEAEQEKKIKRLGRIFTAILVGIPYIVALAIIELLKTQITAITSKTVAYFCVLVLVSIAILPIAFKWGKKWCFSLARKLIVKGKTIRTT